MFEGVAPGGAGGGVIGVAGATAGAGGGGGSGRYGFTSLIDCTGFSTATLTFGVGGVGASGANGGAGGNLTVLASAITYTWNGGAGGFVATLNGEKPSSCRLISPE
jgi:hypothetical protein